MDLFSFCRECFARPGSRQNGYQCIVRYSCGSFGGGGRWPSGCNGRAKDTADLWPQVVEGVRFARCPAELADNFTCQQCGNGDPLCARGDRDYVIVFVAHGTGAKRVGTGDGGCYAASGPTAIQWHGTRKTGAANDAETLRTFARSLPPGSFLRHHIAGDIGREVA